MCVQSACEKIATTPTFINHAPQLKKVCMLTIVRIVGVVYFLVCNIKKMLYLRRIRSFSLFLDMLVS